MSVQNKIALITGGSRGLGKNMALRLAQHGNNIIITYNSQQELAENVVKEIEAGGQKATPFQYDLSDFSNNAAIRNNPNRKKMMAAQTALGRVGEAGDIGGVVAFLCSEDAGGVNAQRIEASGGINL